MRVQISLGNGQFWGLTDPFENISNLSSESEAFAAKGIIQSSITPFSLLLFVMQQKIIEPLHSTSNSFKKK